MAGQKLKGRQYTHKWVSGPDPHIHQLHRAFHNHRQQALFRREAYELTWEQYRDIWCQGDRLHRRGRGIGCLWMVRSDPRLPWRVDNIEIKSRRSFIDTLQVRRREARDAQER